MIGNQLNINRNVLNNDKNVIKDIIIEEGKVTKEEIIACINHEYWKQWRKLLINSEHPLIKCDKLGFFELRFKKGKHMIWNIIEKIRWNQKNHPEKKPNDGTMMGQIQGAQLKKLAIVWQQINKLKHRHIKKVKGINQKYIEKGIQNKIRWNYE